MVVRPFSLVAKFTIAAPASTNFAVSSTTFFANCLISGKWSTIAFDRAVPYSVITRLSSKPLGVA